MALILTGHSLLSKNLLLHSPPKPSSPFIVKSQDSSPSSQPPKPTSTTQPIDSSDPPLNNPTSSGLGFGSSSAKSKLNPVSTKKKQSGRSERASIVRRKPVDKPTVGFVSEKEEDGQSKEQLKNESAFLLAWLGLGSVILIEGIVLAASGFLPEEWDNFFVKYLYPSFTPTVFLFVAGTVGYGVSKYLENEKLTGKK